MKIINFNQYDDGNGTALVKFFGCEYAVHWSTGDTEPRIFATAYYRLKDWQRKGQVKKIKDWFKTL